MCMFVIQKKELLKLLKTLIDECHSGRPLWETKRFTIVTIYITTCVCVCCYKCMHQGGETNQCAVHQIIFSKTVGQKKMIRTLRLKFRWFHSKGAALVLVWGLLTVMSNRMVYEVLEKEERASFLILGTGISVVVTAPFFGWLADARLGNYKVVKIGITVSWLASVLGSLFTLLYYNTSLSSDQNVAVRAVLLVLTSLFQWTGNVIIVLNGFQLSLEQIPDASAENITSLISWLALSVVTGLWVGDIITDLFACVSFTHTGLYQVFTLFPVICTSVNVISYHLISSKWLIIEPKSPQSLKNIYRVLKFAAKHKAPLNRSALTYWEDNIPSRLDLGKSRYGGPFTTEQVEDVKTFFRILAASVGIFLTTFALGVQVYEPLTKININVTMGACEKNSLYLFTLHPFWYAILMVLVKESLIYPCFQYRLPSSMKTIGITSFAIVLRSITFLILSILGYFNIVENRALWTLGLNSILYGVLAVTLIAAMFEFVCAQAPYNMRGLMNGYIQLVFWLAFFGSFVYTFNFIRYCQAPTCSLINASVGAVVSFFAFLLYLIVASWYKRRVRDDIDTPHKWVEDVYDRYLSAAVNNS